MSVPNIIKFSLNIMAAKLLNLAPKIAFSFEAWIHCDKKSFVNQPWFDKRYFLFQHTIIIFKSIINSLNLNSRRVFRISLWWPIHIINPVLYKAKLSPHRRGTSLFRTFPPLSSLFSSSMAKSPLKMKLLVVESYFEIGTLKRSEENC